MDIIEDLVLEANNGFEQKNLRTLIRVCDASVQYQENKFSKRVIHHLMNVIKYEKFIAIDIKVLQPKLTLRGILCEEETSLSNEYLEKFFKILEEEKPSQQFILHFFKEVRDDKQERLDWLNYYFKRVTESAAKNSKGSSNCGTEGCSYLKLMQSIFPPEISETIYTYKEKLCWGILFDTFKRNEKLSDLRSSEKNIQLKDILPVDDELHNIPDSSALKDLFRVDESLREFFFRTGFDNPEGATLCKLTFDLNSYPDMYADAGKFVYIRIIRRTILFVLKLVLINIQSRRLYLAKEYSNVASSLVTLLKSVSKHDREGDNMLTILELNLKTEVTCCINEMQPLECKACIAIANLRIDTLMTHVKTLSGKTMTEKEENETSNDQRNNDAHVMLFLKKLGNYPLLKVAHCDEYKAKLNSTLIKTVWKRFNAGPDVAEINGDCDVDSISIENVNQNLHVLAYTELMTSGSWEHRFVTSHMFGNFVSFYKYHGGSRGAGEIAIELTRLKSNYPETALAILASNSPNYPDGRLHRFVAGVVTETWLTIRIRRLIFESEPVQKTNGHEALDFFMSVLKDENELKQLISKRSFRRITGLSAIMYLYFITYFSNYCIKSENCPKKIKEDYDHAWDLYEQYCRNKDVLRFAIRIFYDLFHMFTLAHDEDGNAKFVVQQCRILMGTSLFPLLFATDDYELKKFTDDFQTGSSKVNLDTSDLNSKLYIFSAEDYITTIIDSYDSSSSSKKLFRQFLLYYGTLFFPHDPDLNTIIKHHLMNSLLKLKTILEQSNHIPGPKSIFSEQLSIGNTNLALEFVQIYKLKEIDWNSYYQCITQVERIIFTDRKAVYVFGEFAIKKQLVTKPKPPLDSIRSIETLRKIKEKSNIFSSILVSSTDDVPGHYLKRTLEVHKELYKVLKESKDSSERSYRKGKNQKKTDKPANKTSSNPTRPLPGGNTAYAYDFNKVQAAVKVLEESLAGTVPPTYRSAMNAINKVWEVMKIKPTRFSDLQLQCL